jgi:hypothetical protein
MSVNLTSPGNIINDKSVLPHFTDAIPECCGQEWVIKKRGVGIKKSSQ